MKNEVWDRYKKFRLQGGRPSDFQKSLKYQEELKKFNIEVHGGRGYSLYELKWKYNGFDMKGRVEIDDSYDISYLGEFTNKLSPGCITRRNPGRNEFKYFSPAQDHKELRNFFSTSGYSKHDADVKARQSIKNDFQHAEECGISWNPYGLIVNTYKAGVELGSASLWGIEFREDFENEMKRYALELQEEAVDEAQKTLKNLCNCTS